MSQESLLHTVRQFLLTHRLLAKGEKIIVAVSGGIDSVVLLDLLAALRSAFEWELAVAHLNHDLRGSESLDDQHFVESAAKSYGCECYSERANTRAIAEMRHQSIQEAARELRYEFFGKLRQSLGFQKIATAHHADDSAETMIFNFLRGAGVQGLSGIPKLRRDLDVVRPLLGCTRRELLAYAEEKKLRHREDSSNAKSDYSRNFIRQSVIPLIQENINPNLVATLSQSSVIFDELERYLGEEVRRIIPQLIVRSSAQELILDLGMLRQKERFLQEYLIRHAVHIVTGREIDFGVVKTLVSLTESETGASCALPDDYVVYRNRSQFVVAKRLPMRPFRYPIELNREYQFDQFRFTSAEVEEPRFGGGKHVEYVDAAAIGKELMLRTWHTGDTFVPLGMNAQKKLSDFFIDEKVPLPEKQEIPILISDGKIVWICGKRLDDRFKITPGTQHIIKLEYHPRSPSTE
jgi:tRNA(Ile)-lysidine synthase